MNIEKALNDIVKAASEKFAAELSSQIRQVVAQSIMGGEVPPVAPKAKPEKGLYVLGVAKKGRIPDWVFELEEVKKLKAKNKADLLKSFKDGQVFKRAGK